MSGELDKGERHRGPTSPHFGRRAPITTVEEAVQVTEDCMCVFRRVTFVGACFKRGSLNVYDIVDLTVLHCMFGLINALRTMRTK